MLIPQLNREGPERIYVAGQNVAGETVSVGVFLCWDWRNATSHGSAVAKPATSNLPLFAGVLCGRSPSAYTDLPANSIGLIQCYGPMGSVAYNVGGASLSCAGQYLIPINAQYSGQTNQISGVGLNWTSQHLIVPRGAFLMTNDLSGTGWAQAFVRAM